MEITVKNYDQNKYLPKFQEGGEMPVEDPNAAPAEQAPAEQGGDPLMQIVQAAAQAVQTQDAQLALQVCQALVEMASGGQQAQPEAPGQPVYRKGGRLAYWK